MSKKKTDLSKDRLYKDRTRRNSGKTVISMGSGNGKIVVWVKKHGGQNMLCTKDGSGKIVIYGAGKNIKINAGRPKMNLSSIQSVPRRGKK